MAISTLCQGADHVRDLVEQVLFTDHGDRVIRPKFGAGPTTSSGKVRAESGGAARAEESVPSVDLDGVGDSSHAVRDPSLIG
jgi:hypothetical protein